jgi:acyl-CoA synthetase (AMP-forming)/AMP-acid ligase II
MAVAAKDRTFIDTLQRQAHAFPTRTALITPTKSWTYAELDAESDRVAQGLRALGIGSGDRVGCVTKHTADCTLLTFGAMKIGAVCAPFNWRLAAPELNYLVTYNQVRLLVADSAFLPTLASVDCSEVKQIFVTDGSDPKTSFAAWRSRYDAIPVDYEPAPEDTALQLSSSGTTGLPKSVELTHANVLANCKGGAACCGYTGGRYVQLNSLPNYHIAGMGVVMLLWYEGGTTVLYPEFEPAKILAGVAEHGITHMFLVPAMILFLLQTPGIEAADFSTLKAIAYGASPISDKVLRDAIRVFGCGFYQLYGLTETTGLVTCLPAEDHDPDGPRAHLLRSAGRAANGAELRVVDSATGRDLADGEVGEIWIRSLQNMKGYYRNAAATVEAFPLGRDNRGGWIRTGDAGYLRDGYVYVHDRIKDMVITGGENVYPAEVENVLASHPGIAEVAVIGVPDDQWGEAVKACIVRKPGATAAEKEIIDFARERMAHYKCPKSIDFVDTLPRNPTGKLLKRILREKYWAGHDRRII